MPDGSGLGSTSRIPPTKRHHLTVMPFHWWGKVDSNHRSYKQQIYSLSPLATREFPQIFSSQQNFLMIQHLRENVKHFLTLFEKGKLRH